MTRKDFGVMDANQKEVDNPVDSIVKVRFYEDPREFMYYNDQFALKVGDTVYVEGEFAETPGHVTAVYTHFRNNRDDYEKVLAKPDKTVHGSYHPFYPMVLSYSEEAVTFQQYFSWISTPGNGGLDEPTHSGNVDYPLDPVAIIKSDFISDDDYQRCTQYCKEARIQFLSLRGKEGIALFADDFWYVIRFYYEDGLITEISCDCPGPDFCDHMICLCITLNVLLAKTREKYAAEFAKSGCLTALDSEYFCDIAVLSAEEVIL